MPKYVFTNGNRSKPVITEFKRMSEYVDDECEVIISHKAKNKDKRPQLTYNGKTESAARCFWLLLIGEIPKEKPFVLHQCHNPECIRINHLKLGNFQDNANDKVQANRSKRTDETKQRISKARIGMKFSQKHKDSMSVCRKGKKTGEDCPFSKLTEVQVKEIKRLLDEKKLTQREIAKRFNIHGSNVSMIKKGKTWTS